jgi:hypothetical protein
MLAFLCSWAARALLGVEGPVLHSVGIVLRLGAVTVPVPCQRRLRFGADLGTEPRSRTSPSPFGEVLAVLAQAVGNLGGEIGGGRWAGGCPRGDALARVEDGAVGEVDVSLELTLQQPVTPRAQLGLDRSHQPHRLGAEYAFVGEGVHTDVAVQDRDGDGVLEAELALQTRPRLVVDQRLDCALRRAQNHLGDALVCYPCRRGTQPV